MVAEIGAGTLPHPTFRYYFEQNVLYLEDYARAIALIIGRAPDRAGLGVLTRFLAQIVETELPANYAFLARLGGTAGPGGNTAMTPVTYAYTRHLLDAAGRHGLATGLAAVLPCQWSYGEIATRLAGAHARRSGLRRLDLHVRRGRLRRAGAGQHVPARPAHRRGR